MNENILSDRSGVAKYGAAGGWPVSLGGGVNVAVLSVSLASLSPLLSSSLLLWGVGPTGGLIVTSSCDATESSLESSAASDLSESGGPPGLLKPEWVELASESSSSKEFSGGPIGTTGGGNTSI